MEVLAREVWLGSRGFEGLIPCVVLNALVSFKCVLHVEDLSIFVDPLEGICTVAMHMAVTFGRASVSVHDGKCMHRFWHLAEKVPLGIGVEGVFDWVLLHSVEEIGCHNWVPKEEDREVYSSHVIVPLVRIELQSKASYISQ